MSEIRPEDSTIPKSQMADLLRKVCSVLNDHEIDYFLTCGTLLGYIREGDFIEWDTDIDLGVFDVDEVLKQEDQFQKQGLRIEMYLPDHSVPMSLKLHLYDEKQRADFGLQLDFFEFENTGDSFIFRMMNYRGFVERTLRLIVTILKSVIRNGISSDEGIRDLIEVSSMPSWWKRITGKFQVWIKKYLIRQYLHVFEPFTCVEAEWFGFTVNIPSNPEDHLRLLYGDEWRIPKPDYFHSIERQKNIRRVKL